MDALRRAQTIIRARGSNKCPHHQGKEVVFVCEDCDGELTCITCVSTIHKKHIVQKISEAIPQAKVTIQDFVNKTENILIPKLREKMRSLDSEIIDSELRFFDVIDEIQEQNESLKQEIDKITDKLIKLCREIGTQNNNIFQNHKTELQSRIEELDTRIHELKNTLQTGTDIQIFDTSRDFPNVTIPALSSVQDVVFNPTSILTDDLENLVGQLSTEAGNRTQVKCSTSGQVYETADNGIESTTVLTTTSNKLSQDKLQSFELLETFKSKWEIYRIQSVSENPTWVYTGRGVLRLLNDAEQSRTLSMEVLITDFCVSPSTGDIWFCSDVDNSVRYVNRQKSTISFHTNREPISICISEDGNIKVGIEGQIVKYTERGQILSNSRVVKRVPEVRYPYRISPCPVTRNIAVVDLDYKDCRGDGKAHVSILNEDLRLLCRYYGRDTEPFWPRDVCHSDTGDIYIAANRSIQQINGSGELIQTVFTGRDEPAHCLCIQSNGDIWAVFGWTSVLTLQKH